MPPIDYDKFLQDLKQNRAKHPDDLHRIFNIRAAAETADSKDMIVEGDAIVFNDRTTLYHDGDSGYTITEAVDPHALDNCDMSDVFMRYNHSNEQPPLARCHGENKGLELTVSNKGLHIRAKIADNQFGRDIFYSIKRGDIDKMSFAFRSQGDTFQDIPFDQGGGCNITLTNITKLIDVAPVMVPAYENTEISARSKERVESYLASLEGQKRTQELALAKARALALFGNDVIQKGN